MPPVAVAFNAAPATPGPVDMVTRRPSGSIVCTTAFAGIPVPDTATPMKRPSMVLLPVTSTTGELAVTRTFLVTVVVAGRTPIRFSISLPALEAPNWPAAVMPSGVSVATDAPDSTGTRPETATQPYWPAA